jgi:hypothetical protein
LTHIIIFRVATIGLGSLMVVGELFAARLFVLVVAIDFILHG